MQGGEADEVVLGRGDGRALAGGEIDVVRLGDREVDEGGAERAEAADGGGVELGVGEARAEGQQGVVGPGVVAEEGGEDAGVAGWCPGHRGAPAVMGGG